MAESSVEFGCWEKEFRVNEFALFWLIMETVLEAGEVSRGADSLDFRLQNLIVEERLGDDWYRSIELDKVIGNDSVRFVELLARAVRHVLSHRPTDFWESLKQPEQAYDVGHDRFGDTPKQDDLVGLIVRFSLPWFSPPEASPLMKAVGWFPIAKLTRDQQPQSPG